MGQLLADSMGLGNLRRYDRAVFDIVLHWAAAISYPLNIGGRPYNSWPAFTVSSFEVTLLFAIAAGFAAFLAASRLPLLYHPGFLAPNFARASQDRFFLSIEARDPRYDAATIRAILDRHGAMAIDEVWGLSA